MKDCSSTFRQSLNDFPCLIELGKKNPSFGINRWNKNCLRFTPIDDEGFTLRGDRQRLLYKGRRRSHRFTILNDGAFEYDCILLREPESNVICLRMEGAEKYDFFRQPDFVSDPFLKGSYAVYKKETLVGEGTGKLCHIHRPLIIDALNRRCWGDLSIFGNELHITIPEQWLSQAKYPVTVDPTIGTTTIGSLTNGTDPNMPSFNKPYLDNEYILNKFLISENGSGQCTAYVYTYDTQAGWVQPILYNQVNNKPYKKLSKNERNIDVEITSTKKAGWRNNTFNIDGNLNSGNYIWFGLFSDWFTTRFDYGLDCYKGWFDWDEYADYEDEPTPYIDDWAIGTFCNLKFSMYFTYTAVQSQSYTRTLTQGVKLTDTRKSSIDFKRQAVQSVNVNTPVITFYTYLRTVIENVGNYVILTNIPIKIRNIFENVKINAEILKHSEINRTCNETLINTDTTNRSQGFIRKIVETILNTDDYNFSFYFMRSVNETQTLNDFIHKTRNFFRLLYEEAGNISQIKRHEIFNRTENDFVKAESHIFRQLFVFIKILTTALTRDFLFKHFLIAREELVLKSCITREINLESFIS